MKDLTVLALVYFAAISFTAAAFTCADKHLSKKQLRRVPEKQLFILAFLGGALAEYVTMRLIRHKTLHKRFMLGLPVIVLLQIVLIVILISLK